MSGYSSRLTAETFFSIVVTRRQYFTSSIFKVNPWSVGTKRNVLPVRSRGGDISADPALRTRRHERRITTGSVRNIVVMMR